jgi:hypothetical protein
MKGTFRKINLKQNSSNPLIINAPLLTNANELFAESTSKQLDETTS